MEIGDIGDIGPIVVNRVRVEIKLELVFVMIHLWQMVGETAQVMWPSRKLLM